MKNLRIVSIPKKKITNSQQKDIGRLQKECFGNVDETEIKEHFFAEGFAMVLTYQNNGLVGILKLLKRQCEFDGFKFLLGGAAGACVTKCMRKQDIGSRLMKKGLKTLQQNGCAVACMNVDLEVKMYGFYEKLGFKMMEREVSFDDIYGKRIYEKGTMFIPLCSNKIYNHIMNSHKTFHYGKGYW